jgi:hypothetical protein
MKRRRKPAKYAMYHEGRVHLCSRMCSTCIFLPGNKMFLEPGRVEEMVAASLKNDSGICCHATIGTEHPAVCKGFLDRHHTIPIRLAQVMGLTAEVDPRKYE